MVTFWFVRGQSALNEKSQPAAFVALSYVLEPIQTVLLYASRPRAVINLRLFTWSRFDDHGRFRRYCSAQPAYETLDALVAAREPVLIDQILPDAHRVAAPRQFQLDHLAVSFADTYRAPAVLLRRHPFRQKAGGHQTGRFCMSPTGGIDLPDVLVVALRRILKLRKLHTLRLLLRIYAYWTALLPAIA
jgi:hypothetical protein